MKQLPKYEIYADTEYWWGDQIAVVNKTKSEDGNWIKKEDLIEWLHHHLREGSASVIYSDLLTELGE